MNKATKIIAICIVLVLFYIIVQQYQTNSVTSSGLTRASGQPAVVPSPVPLLPSQAPLVPSPVEPSPEPLQPSPVPLVPSPVPLVPSPVPLVPSPVPLVQTPAPPVPIPEPLVPSPVPRVPTPVPTPVPIPEPLVPSPAPLVPTPVPIPVPIPEPLVPTPVPSPPFINPVPTPVPLESTRDFFYQITDMTGIGFQWQAADGFYGHYTPVRYNNMSNSWDVKTNELSWQDIQVISAEENERTVIITGGAALTIRPVHQDPLVPTPAPPTPAPTPVPLESTRDFFYQITDMTGIGFQWQAADGFYGHYTPVQYNNMSNSWDVKTNELSWQDIQVISAEGNERKVIITGGGALTIRPVPLVPSPVPPFINPVPAPVPLQSTTWEFFYQITDMTDGFQWQLADGFYGHYTPVRYNYVSNSWDVQTNERSWRDIQVISEEGDKKTVIITDVGTVTIQLVILPLPAPVPAFPQALPSSFYQWTDEEDLGFVWLADSGYQGYHTPVERERSRSGERLSRWLALSSDSLQRRIEVISSRGDMRELRIDGYDAGWVREVNNITPTLVLPTSDGFFYQYENERNGFFWRRDVGTLNGEYQSVFWEHGSYRFEIDKSYYFQMELLQKMSNSRGTWYKVKTSDGTEKWVRENKEVVLEKRPGPDSNPLPSTTDFWYRYDDATTRGFKWVPDSPNSKAGKYQLVFWDYNKWCYLDDQFDHVNIELLETKDIFLHVKICNNSNDCDTPRIYRSVETTYPLIPLPATKHPTFYKYDKATATGDVGFVWQPKLPEQPFKGMRYPVTLSSHGNYFVRDNQGQPRDLEVLSQKGNRYEIGEVDTTVWVQLTTDTSNIR